MELKHIKELMASMGRTGMKKLSIKREGFELELERHDQGVQLPSQESDLSELEHSGNFQAIRRAPQALPKADASSITGSHPPEAVGTFITSPMVGTFYNAPSPDDAPFVKVGDKVDKNTVVCIIEAMKVMNEIKANATGIVSEVLVDSATPVEFGTKLYRIT